MSASALILWDIDRTLVYVGETDRLIYRQLVRDLLNTSAEHLPAKGTGRTVPLAVQELLQRNGARQEGLDALVKQALAELPDRLWQQRGHMHEHGQLLAGARQALRTVHAHPAWVASVVTGNLQRSAQIKLDTFGLADFVDTALGGYSSDDPHRPHLVGIAQQRAGTQHNADFTRLNTVIIGDSLEDVTTGREGGAQVLGVASGTTTQAQLREAGADRVLPDLTDPQALTEALTSLIGTPGN